MLEQTAALRRRDFCKANLSLLSAIAAAGITGLSHNCGAQQGEPGKVNSGNPLMQPIAIATWNFGMEPCKKAFNIMNTGGQLLDAVEHGIQVAELDVENRSVGIGGIPNAEGVVQLDACIMTGDRKAGSVAALEGFSHPISVARRVMEQTPHVMLVGEGAAKFALEQGFTQSELLVPREREAYQRWQAKRAGERNGGIDPVESSRQEQAVRDGSENHDTIALLAADGQGDLAGGCSTSGWGYKLAGRVGDSPIIGSGLYVDGDVGAAGATGLGEIMMRYCGSFLVVEAMRRGATPEQACEEAVRRIVAGERKSAGELSVNFIAISKDGTVGAAGTDAGFEFAVVTKELAEIRKPLRVI